MKINGEGFQIRSWTLEDVPSLARYANNAKVSANLRDGFPYPYSETDAESFISAQLDAPWNFTIAVNGAASGGIGLVVGADVHRFTAEIGYWLAEPCWGKGITSKAVQALTDYAFQHSDLVRIYATVFETNRASMRVLEKNGFLLEGILRKNVIKNGVTMNSYLYAKIKA
ncbi:MAG: GNAT family N-acetyltransferase [Saprospiraceae bacterium]|nr:GNAT family N-acetyltransferase [Saprospiraceae bacterium]